MKLQIVKVCRFLKKIKESILLLWSPNHINKIFYTFRKIWLPNLSLSYNATNDACWIQLDPPYCFLLGLQISLKMCDIIIYIVYKVHKWSETKINTIAKNLFMSLIFHVVLFSLLLSLFCNLPLCNYH